MTTDRTLMPITLTGSQQRIIDHALAMAPYISGGLEVLRIYLPKADSDLAAPVAGAARMDDLRDCATLCYEDLDGLEDGGRALRIEFNGAVFYHTDGGILGGSDRP